MALQKKLKNLLNHFLENKLKDFLQGFIGGLIVFGFPLFIWQLSDPTWCVDGRFFTSYPVAINQLKECYEPTHNHNKTR